MVTILPRYPDGCVSVEERGGDQWPQPQLPPQHPPPPPTAAPWGREVANEDSSRVTVELPQSGQVTVESPPAGTSSSKLSEHPAHRYS